jgi:hypothetical protein
MATQFIDNSHAIRKSTKPYQLLPFFIALVCALTIHPAKAHAQIIGELKLTSHFSSTQGPQNFPRASTYFVCWTTPA